MSYQRLSNYTGLRFDNFINKSLKLLVISRLTRGRGGERTRCSESTLLYPLRADLLCANRVCCWLSTSPREIRFSSLLKNPCFQTRIRPIIIFWIEGLHETIQGCWEFWKINTTGYEAGTSLVSGEGWGIGSETHVRDKTGCVPDILKTSVYKSFHHHCSHSEVTYKVS